MHDALTVFRAALPMMPRVGVVALRDALRDDDPALVRGTTYTFDAETHAPNAGCAMYYPFWKANPNASAGDVAEMMQPTWDEARGIDAFLAWYDSGDTPRPEMWAALLPVVEEYLAGGVA